MERDYRQFGIILPMSVGLPIPVWMCPDDGDFVLDTSLHNRWHAWVDAHGSIGAVERLNHVYRKPEIR